MFQFESILFCPLGHQDNLAATRRVGQLAAQNQARVTLFGTVVEPTRLQRLLHTAEFEQKLIDAERQALDERLERCRSLTGDADTEVLIAIGDPAQSIIEQVQLAGHDLVVVTTDAEHPQPAAFKRLLRKCPCPVWVLRPNRERKQRILAAVNPDPSEAGLNTTVLEVAACIADLDDGELHVVHAWELYGESAMRHSAFVGVPEDEVEDLLDKERTHREAALRDLLGSTLGGETQPQVHLAKGNPSEVIPALVTKQRITMLVIGTVARAGIAGKIMGNTAEQILDQVSCSVVAAKPPGFVSPVPVPAR